MRKKGDQSGSGPSKSKAARSAVITQEQFGFEDEENFSGTEALDQRDVHHHVALAAEKLGGRKRGLPDDSEAAETDGNDDFGQEMQKMLDSFGADVSKTLSKKRKRLSQYTQSTMHSSSRKVEDICKTQQNERQKLHAEYCKQIVSLLETQWQPDLEKVKEQEEKLEALIQKQQKLFQQTRVVLSQRLKTMKQLHEQYFKSLEELEQRHEDQQSSVQAELKKEMSLLQKRILMDTQQQEMANVRKSLQTMLF